MSQTAYEEIIMTIMSWDLHLTNDKQVGTGGEETLAFIITLRENNVTVFHFLIKLPKDKEHKHRCLTCFPFDLLIRHT